MKNLLPLFLLSFLFSTNSFSQSPGVECTEAGVICNFEDLNGFSFTLKEDDSPGSQPNPLCPSGGSPDNILWLGFIAQQGDYTLKVYGGNCSGSSTGDEGLQLGLYTDCTFLESVFCNPGCELDSMFISSDVLVAGSTYYMFADGCFGSVCEIFIEIEGEYEGDYCDPLSIAEELVIPSQSSLFIYPNPAKDQVYFASKHAFNKVIVYNATTQVKIKQVLDTAQLNIELDVEGWESGIYFVEMRNGKRKWFSKFIVGR